MTGALLMGGIVLITNLKVISDSNSLNYYTISANLISSLSFFIMFYIVSGN